MNKGQHVVVSGMIMVVALLVCLVSFIQQPAEAYLFPRLVASLFVLCALWTLGKALLGKSEASPGFTLPMVTNLLPGLIVLLVYVFWAAKGVGFYVATMGTVFILLSIYGPQAHSRIRTWVIRAIISTSFAVVLYGLFAKLLRVHTPGELLF